MRQERMKILSLLEEGKITADEAEKLLQAINSGSEERGFFNEETAEQAEEKWRRFTRNVEGFAREFGAKMECAYRDVEPKLKKAGSVVLERTAAVFDEISKSLQETIEKSKAKEAEECCENTCCEDTCCESGEENDDLPREN